ncbi:MAG: carboxypeptidase regulatory-like domain-containing protein [Verrucomicrobiota bacterium]
MTRLRMFENGTFFLASIGWLALTACSGCNGKHDAETSRPLLHSSNAPSTVFLATNAPGPNTFSSPGSNPALPAGISGKIILKGTPPPEKNISLTSDCGPLHPRNLQTRFYVIGENGALADVFVYIKDGLSGKTFDPPVEPVLLDQAGCEYTPYVVGLQTKQKLLVRNSDPMMHNVHVIPKADGNKEANKAQMPKSKELVFGFDNPEIFVTFKCDVHPWMFTYVGVVDHPFFAVSGKDGKFILKNVPDGKYLIEAVHRKAGRQTKEITVGAGKSEPVEFVLEVTGQ